MSARGGTKRDLLKTIEGLQAEVTKWVDRESEKNRKLGACMIELQAYKAWAEKIDRWHTELCGMVGIPPVHPANAGHQILSEAK